MTVLRLLALSSLSTIAMSHSCEKQAAATPCEGTPTAVTAQAMPMPTGCSWAALRGETKTYIINSATELAAATQCGGGTWPVIDFAQYTLLAGRAPMTGGAVLRTQVVEKDCQGKYTHTVAIADGPTLSPTYVVVPKLPGTTTVSFAVTKTR